MTLPKGSGIVLLFALNGVPSTLPAQETYRSSQLNCAGFAESIHASITTESGDRVRREIVQQSGLLRLAARDTGDAIAIEAWFDSLVVWRDAEEGRILPETDGVIGGRYRGLLSPDGRYLRTRSPFVPADIAEVINLATTMDDLLPPLPRIPLEPGQQWTDSTGLVITRLADSASAGGPLRRYEAILLVAPRAIAAEDSGGVAVVQGEEHRGVFVWHEAEGVRRWDREIRIATEIPIGAGIRLPIRASVTQRIELTRVSGKCR